MQDLTEDALLDFACPGCRYKFQKTLGWLQTNTHAVCPACGSEIKLNMPEREALGNLFSTLRKFKKKPF